MIAKCIGESISDKDNSPIELNDFEFQPELFQTGLQTIQ